MTRQKSLFVFLYFFLSLFLIFLESKSALGGLHKFSQKVFSPASTALYKSRPDLSGITGNFSQDKNKRILELETKNADLLSQVSRAQALEDENAHLKSLLGADPPKTWLFSPARVLRRFADQLYITGEFVPAIGMPVVYYDTQEETPSARSGVFLGRVEEVVGGEVKVDLVTNPRSRIEAYTKGAHGILEGRGGKVILDQILTTDQVFAGDLVLTSGQNVPPDLLVGQVIKVYEGGSLATKQAEVKTILDAGKLGYVYYLTKF